MGSIHGCSAYYDRFLEDPGIPVVFECTGSSKIGSPGGFLSSASEASKVIGELLGLDFRVYGLEHWEYIGRRFNLYAFSLASMEMIVGQVRVVETGGVLVNVSGALSTRVSLLVDKSVWDSLKSGVRLKTGYNMGITFLKPSIKAWPEGQKAIPKYVIYAAEGVQSVDPKTWRLEVKGEVYRRLTLTLEELAETAVELEERDFHCVTGWSVKSNKWLGVRIGELASKAGASEDSKWLLAYGVAGYSTIVPIEEALREDSIVAIGLNGKQLTPESGYPARLLIPRLYGWKSAKWVKELVFLKDYIDGYWEALAYHERGLVDAQERFKVRNPEIADRGELPENPRPIKPG
ncbi:MAG: molybdopterin-dependent oxidoreductase [Thermoprotei archaeon]|nr:molybdopterin-dependent oxidoreductase [Thermoprotei archaeon]